VGQQALGRKGKANMLARHCAAALSLASSESAIVSHARIQRLCRRNKIFCVKASKLCAFCVNSGASRYKHEQKKQEATSGAVFASLGKALGLCTHRPWHTDTFT
jgi:hypothetical protein